MSQIRIRIEEQHSATRQSITNDQMATAHKGQNGRLACTLSFIRHGSYAVRIQSMRASVSRLMLAPESVTRPARVSAACPGDEGNTMTGAAAVVCIGAAIGSGGRLPGHLPAVAPLSLRGSCRRLEAGKQCL